ncbi:core-2/I-Branching enzyme [Larkinella arboricola]|uniref:Peptide O-xylosyltransferase n=1 Tax=Larkinella arboricola TaxID=643671 RepID=A0A327WQ06_LARAB|nr:beta-1,6-N-acetylglucosaminyltransferase [Larkinella arboricola]RAJ93990.1 core-2/I-Branching enzyme [Larkinella arboricola]
MKLAHLILAHVYPEQLDRLIRALQHPDADFYVHIDQKTDIRPFLKLQQYNNVYFVRKRQKVCWGAYSMVQATLNGFEQIMASAIPYDYINLLSGQDYPLKSPEYIHHFLQKQAGTQFMEYFSLEDEWQEAIQRVNKYHLTHYPIPGKHTLEKLLNTLLPDRKAPEKLTIVGRSQWFTITLEAVKYILLYLRMHPNVKRFFKLTWGADELVFQTLLYNSPFRSRIQNNNLRYIDWSEGKASPKILTVADEHALRASGKLFARKFDTTAHSEILDLLDTKYLTIGRF